MTLFDLEDIYSQPQHKRNKKPKKAIFDNFWF
jgi:hypothetical protein